MSELCQRCNSVPKIGYKYCADCKVLAERETNRTTQITRRQENYSACTECKTVMSYTKYCRKCASLVAKKANNKFYKEKKRIASLCEECNVEPKWSTKGTAKYCKECKVIVQKRNVDEKNKLRDKDKPKRPRKQPIHRGITLDPTAQQPTKKVPKLVSKDGGINPYFLRRGNPTKNGCSSGMTQFNQI